MKRSIDTLAKQGLYEKAELVKKSAGNLELLERKQFDADYKKAVLNKEMQLRNQQQTQLEALRRRIQRGREEHKEHWLMGAQRLMQSHRNMLSDLKSKQALENMRSGVAVQIDLSAVRAPANSKELQRKYNNALPKVDCGRAVVQPKIKALR